MLMDRRCTVVQIPVFSKLIYKVSGHAFRFKCSSRRTSRGYWQVGSNVYTEMWQAKNSQEKLKMMIKVFKTCKNTIVKECRAGARLTNVSLEQNRVQNWTCVWTLDLLQRWHFRAEENNGFLTSDVGSIESPNWGEKKPRSLTLSWYMQTSYWWIFWILT